MDHNDISFFDPKADWLIVERGLPHWAQPGCICFVTWRLGDALPERVLRRLDQKIKQSLQDQGLDPTANWKAQLAKQDSTIRGKVQWQLFSTRDKFLDQGCGACHLAAFQSAEIVLGSLQHFDNQRYFLTDAVVMPNHVHFLAAFADNTAFLKQCTEWKRYMARQINLAVGHSGAFWQVDQFDHLIRSPQQFEHYRRYIADNPKNANLSTGTYLHYQKQLK